MATESITSRLLPVNFAPTSTENSKKYSITDPVTNDNSGDFNHGVQTYQKQLFSGKTGKKVTVTPLIVDFRRLLQARTAVEVVHGISNRDLLHAVVGLYDVSLSDMTPDVLYATVCERWARTIILMRDLQETLEEMQARKESKTSKAKTESKANDEGKGCEEVNGPSSVEEKAGPSATANSEDPDSETQNKEDEDVLEYDEQKPGKFDGVFSDTDDENEDCDDDEEEDFSKGIKTFLAAVNSRKEAREKLAGQLLPEHVGVENRIIAAATFKKAYCKPSERVIHLTLLAVRLRFRKWGIGKYLLQQIKDPQIVGQFDSVVVHADNNAVDFFQRYGFTDDMVLNNKWGELAEQFTNCTLMCYLPPFTGQTMLSETVPELDIIAMDKEIEKWRSKAQEVYIAEMSCVSRMRHEIIHLRALVSSQQQIIKTLMAENDKIQKEKFIIEQEFLDYRKKAAKLSYENEELADEDDDISTDQLLRDLEAEVERTARKKGMHLSSRTGSNRFYLSRHASAEPYCHGRDTAEFYTVTQEFTQAMKADMSISQNYTVKMVTKAMLPPSVDEVIYAKLTGLRDPSMVLRLYYCGSLEQHDRLADITKNGFSEKDFCYGDYGRGLYFSKYPSKAAQFSAFGKLLVAEVGLGNTQTVVKKDRARSGTEGSYESIITPGRLSPESNQNDCTLCQEYIIFDVNQARPLYLIEYAPIST